MPKSKRNKQVSLTNTKKKGIEQKKNLVKDIQECVDKYANIFVFTVNNMRNTKLKDVREQWKHSRFFFGKNKVTTLALGRTPEDEFKPNLHLVSDCIKDQCGLLFSNKPKEEVVRWFDTYVDVDYARSGTVATESVTINEGPLTQFSHSLEPYLRQLGLPTTLQKGVIHLVKDFKVCTEGETLTPEAARILKLLGNQMAEFQMKISCIWSNDGTFEDLKPPKISTKRKAQKMEVDSSSAQETKKRRSDGDTDSCDEDS